MSGCQASVLLRMTAGFRAAGSSCCTVQLVVLDDLAYRANPVSSTVPIQLVSVMSWHCIFVLLLA